MEAERGRADDYYLAEGTGIARRFTATDGHVTELAPLTGEAYETWVAGRDPVTGEPRGRLRTDAHAVRFVEVVVNGPKTWSLAADLRKYAGLPIVVGSVPGHGVNRRLVWDRGRCCG